MPATPCIMIVTLRQFLIFKVMLLSTSLRLMLSGMGRVWSDQEEVFREQSSLEELLLCLVPHLTSHSACRVSGADSHSSRAL